MMGKHLREVLRLAVETAEPGGREICGVIVDSGHCLELVRTRNKARQPGSFALSPVRVKKIRRAARKLGHRVVGAFHSHPVSEAEPGPSDIRGARRGELMLILSCWDREARLWRIGKGRAHPVRLECVEV